MYWGLTSNQVHIYAPRDIVFDTEVGFSIINSFKPNNSLNYDRELRFRVPQTGTATDYAYYLQANSNRTYI